MTGKIRVIITVFVLLLVVVSVSGFAGQNTEKWDTLLQTKEIPGIHTDSLISISSANQDSTTNTSQIKRLGNVIPENYDSNNNLFITILRGVFGLLMLVLICYLFSTNRRNINWKIVVVGLTIQLLLAIGILKVPFIRIIFEFVGKIFVRILDFTRAGSEFLFGGFLDTDTYGFIFAFQVLPTIIFFSALTSLLFYLGIIQKVVHVLAWMLSRSLRLSGAESLSVAGNIFLGQTESPLMIKEYIPDMSKSEVLLVMIGGMATLAGGVLAAYISFLGGDDPLQRLLFAKHLLAASIMAAPGAVVASKILYPQTETVDKNIEITKDKVGSNVLDAISRGTTQGLALAVNVAAMLLVFLAFFPKFLYIQFDRFPNT